MALRTLTIPVEQLSTRYAQEHKGEKLHLVYDLANGNVTTPFCGKRIRGWRMTINMPLGNACKNCLRVWRARTGGGG